MRPGFGFLDICPFVIIISFRRCMQPMPKIQFLKLDCNFQNQRNVCNQNEGKKKTEMHILTIYDNTVYEINEFDFNTSLCQHQMNIEQPPANSQKSTKLICWNWNGFIWICVSCVLGGNDFLWMCYMLTSFWFHFLFFSLRLWKNGKLSTFAPRTKKEMNRGKIQKWSEHTSYIVHWNMESHLETNIKLETIYGSHFIPFPLPIHLIFFYFGNVHLCVCVSHHRTTNNQQPLPFTIHHPQMPC